jgi:hypothetical protein
MIGSIKLGTLIRLLIRLWMQAYINPNTTINIDFFIRDKFLFP